MNPSGADRGFFQEAPVLANQFYDDASFRRCFRLFLPADTRAKTEADVAALGRDVLDDQVFAWITDAERNEPHLRGSGRDVFGRRSSQLVTAAGWRELHRFSTSRGMVACGYDTPFGPFSRPLQFLRTLLWTPSCANVGCPSAMQDGAASLLRKHLTTPGLASGLSAEQRRVFEDAYARLTSRDPAFAWTSGQWMTERPGGSDVSLTETTAVLEPERGRGGLASGPQNLPLGPWTISGFKWFSSATDSRMAVLLARTPTGLSAFFAPMHKHNPGATAVATGRPLPDGECLNGVSISRLKDKSGTRSLPTAELVLEGMRGWLIGQEGRGVHEISAVLNLTRVHSAVSAVGGIGRGLAIARSYARLRQVGNGRGARMGLAESPLHMRTLAKMTADYRGLMLLSLLASYVVGLSEHPPTADSAPAPALAAMTPAPELTEPLLRVLTQLTKAYVCKASVPLMFACMESLGGVGYLWNEAQEHLNVARIFRDLCVGPIWEGTTDVLCTDFVRALKHPKGGAGSLAALEDIIRKGSTFEGRLHGPNGWRPAQRWAALKSRVASEAQADLMSEAREIVWEVADILVSVLLYLDASTDGDSAAADIFLRFLEARDWTPRRAKGTTDEELRRDRAIVYGTGGLASPPPKL
ncbi:hypothetical protein CDD83_11040 [Cordyceps sp. RAO-2017]|nr:hypothetical protein CDD83_11040 [Cordyceps sp. RAO-2017]